MRDDLHSRTDALRQVVDWYHRNGFRTVVDGAKSEFALDRNRHLVRPQLSVFEGKMLVRVVEVETGTSLGPIAVARWREAMLSGMPVYVYVPFSHYATAWHLHFEADLPGVHLQTYDDEANTMMLSVEGSFRERA